MACEEPGAHTAELAPVLSDLSPSEQFFRCVAGPTVELSGKLPLYLGDTSRRGERENRAESDKSIHSHVVGRLEFVCGYYSC
jgi:hypothetical protein